MIEGRKTKRDIGLKELGQLWEPTRLREGTWPITSVRSEVEEKDGPLGGQRNGVCWKPFNLGDIIDKSKDPGENHIKFQKTVLGEKK